MYRIEATEKTPEIVIDNELGVISIKGISVSDNPNSFFEEPLKQFSFYLDQAKENSVVEFYLSYFNTNTALIIRDMLRKIENLPDSSIFKIKWYFEADDEDMKEVGDEFRQLFKSLDFDLEGIVDEAVI